MIYEKAIVVWLPHNQRVGEAATIPQENYGIADFDKDRIMGKIPVDLRTNVATNIRNCRNRKYPQWGGSKKCAADFGVSPQQWSQWERGAHMPDEFRMMEIARFFGVSIEYLRRDNSRAVPVSFNGPLRAQRMDGLSIVDEEEPPLRVEVERMPAHCSGYPPGMMWREVTITLERKY